MKKFVTSFVIASFIGFTTLAQSVLDGASRVVVMNHNSIVANNYVIAEEADDYVTDEAAQWDSKNRHLYDPDRVKRTINPQSLRIKQAISDDVQIIVRYDVWNPDLSELEQLGARIEANLGNTVTARIPFSRLNDLSKLADVSRVSIARNARLCTDETLSQVQAQEVWSGVGVKSGNPYTGKGVIVGVVDCGIDFGHPVFYDKNGNMRIKRVFDVMGNDYIELYDGTTIKGTEYTTPSEIAGLTGPDNLSHGTHTSSIAAGTKYGVFGGVAPDADIILCPMLEEDINDVNMIACIKYIFDYAQREGKPAVVSMSIGDHRGPHDGTSLFNQTVDELTGDGRIVVLSAGNEGDNELHMHTVFEVNKTAIDTPQAATLLYNKYLINDTYLFYSYDGTPFAVKIFVADKSTGKELATTELFESDKFIALGDTELAEYFTGDVDIAIGPEAGTNNYAVILDFKNCRSQSSGGYYIGVRFFGSKGTEIHGWCRWGSCEFYNGGNPSWGYIMGDTSSTISDMACGNQSISVGSYITKNRVQYIGGGQSTSSGTIGDISGFSSYGPDARGNRRPEVTAPGEKIVAAVSTYDTSTSKFVMSEEFNGKTYNWSDMRGTSMACPAVAGTVALWLQANPYLSPEEIKQIINASSVNDEFTATAPNKFGAGKINALKGIQQIEEMSGIDDVTPDKTLPISSIFPNPCTDYFRVTVPVEQSNLLVEVYSLSGAMLYGQRFSTTGYEVEINLADSNIGPGLYFVRIVGEDVNDVCRLVVRE